MTNHLFELIDLETFIALKRAAPQVTEMPWEAACEVARALDKFSEANEAQADLTGKLYWQASLKELHKAGGLREAFSPQMIGRVCRLAGLTMWREGDGYHAAWSAEQLAIIKDYFKI
jgi:hypothetical protein